MRVQSYHRRRTTYVIARCDQKWNVGRGVCFSFSCRLSIEAIILFLFFPWIFFGVIVTYYIFVSCGSQSPGFLRPNKNEARKGVGWTCGTSQQNISPRTTWWRKHFSAQEGNWWWRDSNREYRHTNAGDDRGAPYKLGKVNGKRPHEGEDMRETCCWDCKDGKYKKCRNSHTQYREVRCILFSYCHTVSCVMMISCVICYNTLWYCPWHDRPRIVVHFPFTHLCILYAAHIRVCLCSLLRVFQPETGTPTLCLGNWSGLARDSK